MSEEIITDDECEEEEEDKTCCECGKEYTPILDCTFTNDLFAKNYGYEKDDVFASFVCKFCGEEFYRKAVKNMSEKERKKYNLKAIQKGKNKS